MSGLLICQQDQELKRKGGLLLLKISQEYGSELSSPEYGNTTQFWNLFKSVDCFFYTFTFGGMQKHLIMKIAYCL